ncbi:MAG: alpha-2-macroglobulin family protein, partial [Armatimonadota bacterium]|nr:alpha-2-macroglobulin family protein [Armatimonadota bacterium]
IVRKFENGEYEPVANKQVQVIVRNPEDTEIAKLTLRTNRFGSFAGEVELPEKASLGRYGIIATIDGEQHFAGFEVAQYRKPEFEVKVTTDKPHYIQGEEIRVRIKATYFFGAPVAEGKANYTVSASPIWWYPFADEFESWYEPPEYYGGEFITRNVTKLGKDGTVEFTVPTKPDPKRALTRDMRYFIRCEVTDQSNRTVFGSASCSVFRAAFQIALSTDRYAYRIGETATVQIQTVNAERKPVSVNLNLALEQERWNAKKRRLERITVERQQVKTNNDGSATATFPLTKSGYYRIACWGRDERGNLTSKESWIWVIAEGDFEYSYPTLELVSDKKTYQVGEVAQVLINTNRKGIWALVTVEGDDILDAFVMPIEHRSSVLELPITKKMQPNCYLRVGYVWEGNFVSANKIVAVPPKDKFLQVEIFADKPVYQPREKVRYRIVTKDFEGKPVSAELSFALVDEAIFAMRADTTPEIRKFFFGQRPNMVETAWERVMVAKDIVTLEKARQGKFLPQLALAGAFQKIGETEIRRRFEDTAFWHPFVITDENGEATLEVPLPDNLTTWRATVRATTLQTQVGSSVHKIRVTKPLLVRLQLPRFFTQGDVSKILTVVHNNTDEPQEVTVGLKAKGAKVSLSFMASHDSQIQERIPTLLITANRVAIAPKSGFEQFATIPPNSAHTFAWWVSVPEVPSNGRAIFTAAVVSESGLKDAVELFVPVRPRGIEVVQSKSGVVETEETMTFRLPDDAIVPASYLEIRLAPSLVGPLLGSLEYLVGYPYG